MDIYACVWVSFCLCDYGCESVCVSVSVCVNGGVCDFLFVCDIIFVCDICLGVWQESGDLLELCYYFQYLVSFVLYRLSICDKSPFDFGIELMGCIVQFK